MKRTHKDAPLEPLTRDQRLKGNKINTNDSNNNRCKTLYLPSSSNIPSGNEALGFLAIELVENCYQQRSPSKELIRNFILDAENIRSEQR